MPQPFLQLGNIRLVRQGIGGGRGSHRMHAEAVDLEIQAGFLPVFSDDVSIE